MIVLAMLAFRVVTLMTERQVLRASGRAALSRPIGVLARGAGASPAQRRLAVALPLAAIVVFGLAYANFHEPLDGDGLAVEAERGPSGQIVRMGSLLVQEIRTGDCFDLPTREPKAHTILSVDAVPCNQPHGAETYARVVHAGGPDAPYPGEQGVALEAKMLCVAEFARFTGHAYGTSPLDVVFLTPDADSWELGRRGTTCALYRTDGTRLTGSARANAV
jgi:hypothetical protein